MFDKTFANNYSKQKYYLKHYYELNHFQKFRTVITIISYIVFLIAFVITTLTLYVGLLKIKLI